MQISQINALIQVLASATRTSFEAHRFIIRQTVYTYSFVWYVLNGMFCMVCFVWYVFRAEIAIKAL
jgi:deferrochelatase/peroxidase EfeB